MHEERFSLGIDGMELPAIFTLPAAVKAAVLLIPGSLNADVDGNFAPMFPGQPHMYTNVYKHLANQLAAQGIAVLRFSKSGPGTGAVARDPELAKASYGKFGQRLRVATAFWEELLRRTPGLPRAAAGHSEGSVVATQLARVRKDVQALVLLSGPSKPLLQLMVWQRFLQGEVAEPVYRQAEAWAYAYAAGGEKPAALAGHPFAQLIEFFYSPQGEPYLRSLEQVDPARELAQVSQPVLIAQGGRDLSVMMANAEALRAVQPRAKVVAFPELQHCYKRAPEGLSPQDSFGLEGECDPAVAAAVAEWLGELG